MLSETSLLVFYIISSIENNSSTWDISLAILFDTALSHFPLWEFIPLINFVYPVDMVINLPFLINTGLIVLLSAISYISLLVFTKIAFSMNFLNHVLALKNKFKNHRSLKWKQLTVEDAKQIELEILDYIDTLCVKHNINYIINYGTLIGGGST